LVSLRDAKRLRSGTTLYHKRYKNADGSAERWRVSGKPKTWKTRPKEVQVPIKHGLYDYSYLTHYNLNEFTLKEPKRVKRRRR